MRIFLLATASTIAFLSVLQPAYSMESDSAAASTDQYVGSGTPFTPPTPLDTPPQTPDIEGAAAAATEQVAGSSAVSHDGGGGGAAAPAESTRTLAQQRNQEMAEGIVNLIMNDPNNQPRYLARLRYTAHDYAENYDKVINMSSGAVPEVQRAVLDHIEAIANGAKLEHTKAQVISSINAEHHRLNINAAPIVAAKEHTPTATNLVSGITAAMSQVDVDRMSQEIITNVGNQLGNHADMAHDVAYYQNLKAAAADQLPQVQQALSEHGGKQLELALSRPLAQGSVAGLYTRDESGVKSPASESEIKKIAKVFQKNKVASIGQGHAAVTVGMQKNRQAAILKNLSLDHATQTHDTVNEHATHMNGMIQAMKDHLEKNHGNPPEAVTALAHIQEAHRQVLADVKQKTDKGRILTADHAQTNLDKLNAAGVHLMNLPNDHGEDGHKAQLQKQQDSLTSALKDHLTVTENHQEKHMDNASGKAKESGFVRSKNFPLPTVSDASSSPAGEGGGGGGGGGGSAAAETQDHTTLSSADHATATAHDDHHSSSADGHPAGQTHETHHDSPTHVTTPHETHTTEHHSSGH
jgi:hypothetical protein